MARMVTAGRAVAGFDSASAMVRVLGAALEGREAPMLAQFPAALEPGLDLLTGAVQRLPRPVVEEAYRRAGWLDAIPASHLREVRSETLAAWVTGQYPRRRYPVVFVGSSNGAVAHLAAALGAPWLPQTLLLAVRAGRRDPDDPAADMQALAPAGRELVEANPGLELHHMHDPVHDRLMIGRMAYFRVKFLALPQAYREFIARCLAPGGTIVLVDCELSWPVTTVAERHVFQFGAAGGVSVEEFSRGGPRVAEFLRRHGARRDRWYPPPPDRDAPEAEWGLARPLGDDLAAAAAELGLSLDRLRLSQPENASPLIADLFRDWYAEHGLPAGRLLVSSFVVMDPVLAMRTGQVPYWALFGVRPSLDRLSAYLSQAAPYDEIRLTVFPHGVESIGLPTVSEWQAVTQRARRRGELVAVDPGRYPRHFRAIPGFHRDLSRLPRVPSSPPLGWEQARRYLAAHAAAHQVTFGQDPPLASARPDQGKQVSG
jgi:hypothetical protein